MSLSLSRFNLTPALGRGILELGVDMRVLDITIIVEVDDLAEEGVQDALLATALRFDSSAILTVNQ